MTDAELRDAAALVAFAYTNAETAWENADDFMAERARRMGTGDVARDYSFAWKSGYARGEKDGARSGCLALLDRLAEWMDGPVQGTGNLSKWIDAERRRLV